MCSEKGINLTENEIFTFFFQVLRVAQLEHTSQVFKIYMFKK